MSRLYVWELWELCELWEAVDMTATDAMPRGWVPSDTTFGARLALVRQQMGWGNVKEAAEACGLPPETWRTWERDNTTPRNLADIAWKIAEATGVDYGWLLDPRTKRDEPAKEPLEPRVLRRSPRSKDVTIYYSSDASGTPASAETAPAHRPDILPASAPQGRPRAQAHARTHPPGHGPQPERPGGERRTGRVQRPAS